MGGLDILSQVPPHILEVIRAHQREAPVRVGALARALGLEVRNADLQMGISGQLTERDGKWVIRVNRHENKKRQRFTVAHEIAHFILHRDQIDSELTDDTFYRSGLSERKEVEANKLAAEILMPWALISQVTAEEGKTTAELADELRVSEVALKIRLGLPT